MSKLEEMTANLGEVQKPAAGAQNVAQEGQGATQTQGPNPNPPQISRSPEPTKPLEPRKMRVLDTTAVEGPRVHSQVINDSVQNFTFHPGIGLELHPAIAVKFLKHDTFKCVDEKGNQLEWRRAPKQPDELGAGEQIKLSDTETIARVDELSKGALLQRALEMPGGEKFNADSQRRDMIDFIIATTTARRKAKAAPPEMGKDDFVPEVDYGEDAA